MTAMSTFHVALEIWASVTNLIFLILSGKAAFDRQGLMKRFWWLLVLLNGLLLSDIIYYVFEGDTSRMAYYAIRIGTYVEYIIEALALLLTIFNMDSVFNEDQKPTWDLSLKFCTAVISVEIVSRVLNPLFHHYYYFDETNHYVRGDMISLAFFPPVFCIVVWAIRTIRMKRFLSYRIWKSYVVSVFLLAVVVLLGFFSTEVSLIDETASLCVLLFYLSFWFEENDKRAKKKLEEQELILHEIREYKNHRDSMEEKEATT